jgi:hypothetical protein
MKKSLFLLVLSCLALVPSVVFALSGNLSVNTTSTGDFNYTIAWTDTGVSPSVYEEYLYCGSGSGTVASGPVFCSSNCSGSTTLNHYDFYTVSYVYINVECDIIQYDNNSNVIGVKRAIPKGAIESPATYVNGVDPGIYSYVANDNNSALAVNNIANEVVTMQAAVNSVEGTALSVSSLLSSVSSLDAATNSAVSSIGVSVGSINNAAAVMQMSLNNIASVVNNIPTSGGGGSGSSTLSMTPISFLIGGAAGLAFAFAAGKLF